jgi:ubiquinone/menaquinone biosynthesis C-methylase UbiE
MGSVSDNKKYYEKYDWSDAGEEWSAPWGGTRAMWLTSIYPRIGEFLPADRVVEIGAGHGRIAKILHAFTANELVLFDIMDSCVKECARIFEESTKTRCLQTDGHSLNGVEDKSVDLVFSFYSLVAADRETMHSYLREIDRVLCDDGVAFLHHSNAGMYCDLESMDPDMRLRLLAAYREISVDAEKVQQMAADNNLVCVKQECINWDIDEVLSDCMSTIVRPASKWSQEPQLIHNPDFRKERERATKTVGKGKRRTRGSRRIK